MPVEWVEMIDDPTCKSTTFITPENYVVLVKTFKAILQERQFSPIVKIVGPGVGHLTSNVATDDPYVSAFSDTIDLLDAWSVQVLECKKDVCLWNEGSFESRNYVKKQLVKSVQSCNWTIIDIPVYVTKFSSNATRFPSRFDYGHSAPETVDYALPIMDNACGILSSGASNAICWYLANKLSIKSVYKYDGAKRPQRDALALLYKTIPQSGIIFQSNDVIWEHQTTKQ
ncbi:hypothetical protein BDK51DRAFT_31525 [Blyttiomyces helicus]|uniref:Uncharacterized protein n=1 Tax=Blyttiomyces helicus TaxID=388810 RepID=A0A4P9WPP1_9FUNG|nr:hypothetical protein BDK51DRAFT_31525 [Blyttiomyces helicus]|eukprot:RKO94502.1 hypothetical protein BDK51DRAFT_31525 [Blyttiomyces helicus]